MRTLAALFISLIAASPAMASHPGYYGPGPSVVVQVDAFAPGHRPAPRAGYVWIDGYYDAYGWVPGWWEPTYSRAGYAWVPGYWAGPQYIDGYWRANARAGYYWSAGYYDGRSYVRGGWINGNVANYRPHPRAVARYEHRNHYDSRSDAHRHGSYDRGHDARRGSSYAAPRQASPSRPAPATQRPSGNPQSSTHASTRRGVR